MTVFTEGRHAAEFVLSEGNGNISRENGIVAASQTIKAGSILAVVGQTDTVTATAAADPGNTADSGALTLASPAVTSAAQEGVYTVVCTEPASDGGTFEVSDPNGKSIGTAKVGVAFSKQVKFTIADGSGDFVAGDRFEITVATPDGSFQMVEFDPDGTDGSEVVAGIALYPVTTGAGETAPTSYLRRDSTVNGKLLEWPDGITDAQKAAAIQDLESQRNIIVR